MKHTVIFAAPLLAALAPSHADVTALRLDDTQGGFTTSTPQLADNPVHNTPVTGANDNLWGFAADASNEQSQLGTGTEAARLFDYVWVARNDYPGGEDNPALTVNLSGLDTGTVYRVFLYQVTNVSSSSDWGLQASVGDADLVTYSHGDGTSIQTNGNLTLERVLLGEVTGTASTTINIDDRPAGSNVRCFIKGVGVEVVPEPSSSLVLAAFGGLALLRRKR